MTNILRNISLIIVMLMTLRCGDNPDHIQPEVFTLPKAPIPPNDSISNYYDPLLLGKKSIITHVSYGCFHNTSVSIVIDENDGQYFVTVKGEGSGSDKQIQPQEPLSLDSDFRFALLDFNRFYTQVMAKPKDTTKKEEFVFGTINKLTIQGGFRKVEIFLDSSTELHGFYNLLNTINRHSKRKNAS